jgi:hypothetical protein
VTAAEYRGKESSERGKDSTMKEYIDSMYFGSLVFQGGSKIGNSLLELPSEHL